ncbi:MAG: tail fiber domain-containing protein [Candidatus Magasanikbacteria bacterium]
MNTFLGKFSDNKFFLTGFAFLVFVLGFLLGGMGVKIAKGINSTLANELKVSEKIRANVDGTDSVSLQVNSGIINFTGQDYIQFRNDDGLYQLGGGNTPDANTEGVHLEAGSNPNSGEPLFVVESSGGSERLRVEHNGDLQTSNDLEVNGGGSSEIRGDVVINSDLILGDQDGDAIQENQIAHTGNMKIQSDHDGSSGGPYQCRVDGGNGNFVCGQNVKGVTFIATNLGSYTNSDTVCWDGTGSSYIGDCSSSREYKEDISDLSLGMKVLKKLKPREFKWKESMRKTDRKDLGFIAEEVSKVAPLLVDYNEKDGSPQGVKYRQMTALLTKVIQKQQNQINDLEEEVKEMKKVMKNK